ncbi:MAG TPA: hypothetical protein VMX55_14750 [candidate division Zixibacteria bacterium]|nr:hypothetical protein [candidate division Zixibacteria bacterium]
MNSSITKNSNDSLSTEDESITKSGFQTKDPKNENELKNDEIIETREFKGKTLAIELAGGAILGGLSIVFAVLINPYMPTLPGMGIKIFDLIAIPMMVAYIIFGIRSGLLATITGCLGILILPEYMAWLGMIAKFSATLPMIIIPWMFFKLNNFNSSKSRILPIIEESSENLRKYYSWIMLGAILIRLVLMFALNLFVFIPLFSGGFITVKTDPRTALLFGAAYGLWNIVQGVGDAYIPYLLAYPTRFTKIFGTW